MEYKDELDRQLFEEGIIKYDEQNKTIKILGAITAISATNFLKCFKKFEELGFEKIDLLINSQGGDGFAANKIAAAIYRSKISVRGINIGLVYSAAIYIFESCNFRTSLIKGRFAMHKGTYWSKADGKQIDQPDEFCLNLEKMNGDYIAYRIGTTLEIIDAWEVAEKKWNAEEALKDNLIDEILYDYP